MKNFIQIIILVFICFNISIADQQGDKIFKKADDKILENFLENAAKKAKRNISEKGKLDTQDAIALMLRSQFNHIAHLRENMVTKIEFNAFKAEFNAFKAEFNAFKAEFNTFKQNVDYRFSLLESQISFLKWIMMFGFAFIAILQGYVIFKRK